MARMLMTFFRKNTLFFLRHGLPRKEIKTVSKMSYPLVAGNPNCLVRFLSIWVSKSLAVICEPRI